MLYIYIEGDWKDSKDEYESYVSDYFDDVFEPEWFSDKMVQKLIKVVDDSKVIGEGESVNIYNKTLGNIPPKYLSSGCKSLILLYKEDIKINGDRLGDNCIPLLLEIASKKDVEISLSHIPVFPSKFESVIVNTNEKISSMSEFISIKIRLDNL